MTHLRILAEHAKKLPFHHETQLWIGVEDSKPLVWIQYEIKNDGSIWLWSIETHPEHRHQGYATQAIELVKTHHKVNEFNHDGDYTPEGFSYISSKISWKGKTKQRQKFSSMNFVDEWNINYAY